MKQAHNLLKAIAGRPLSLPLVIDVESHTNPYTPADIVTRKSMTWSMSLPPTAIQ